MRHIALMTPVLLLLHSLGCEYSADVGDLPYSERLVISGVISPYFGFSDVLVGRTLRFDEARLGGVDLVSDASVRITIDDVVHVLPQSGSGLYSDSIGFAFGDVCQLEVAWKGKAVRAATRIPYPAAIDTVLVTHDSLSGVVMISVEAIVTPRESEVYIGEPRIFGASGTTYEVAFETNNPMKRSDVLADGALHFFYSLRITAGVVFGIEFTCASYDKPYYDYYVSRGNPSFEGVPLYSYFSGPVKWNVTGDGVGLFVGRASSSRLVPVR